MKPLFFEKIYLVYFVLSFIVFGKPINAIEESNAEVFYQIPLKSATIHIDSFKKIALCRITTQDYIKYTNYDIKECYRLKRNLEPIFQRIDKKNKNRKEAILLFFNKNKKVLMPNLVVTSKRKFSIYSIVYSMRDKSFYFELLDEHENYYFYLINSKRINMQIKN